MTGFVTFVSAGPGDPDLLTVKAVKALAAADAILFDDLSSGPILALARPGADLVGVGKRAGRPSPKQDHVSRLLVDYALTGAQVVRLKSGDSGIFGRLEEELTAVRAAGIGCTIIPGVTSAVAVPALAGIPVTHRTLSQGFTVVSGHVPPGDPRSQLDWKALAATSTTLVLLMAVKCLPEITAALIDGGLPPTTPAAIVADGSTETQRSWTATLADIAAVSQANNVRPPAIVVIGDVAGLVLP